MTSEWMHDFYVTSDVYGFLVMMWLSNILSRVISTIKFNFSQCTQVSDNEENLLKINSKEQWNSEEILLTLHASKQGHSKIFPGGVPKST